MVAVVVEIRYIEDYKFYHHDWEARVHMPVHVSLPVLCATLAPPSNDIFNSVSCGPLYVHPIGKAFVRISIMSF